MCQKSKDERMNVLYNALPFVEMEGVEYEDGEKRYAWQH